VATIGLAAVAILSFETALGVQSASASSTTGVTKTTITVGTNVDLTGPLGSIGQAFEFGEKLAIKQINEHGGIRGRKLNVIYEDDQGTSAGGITAARALIEQDHVLMDIAGGASTAMVGVGPVFEQSKVPLLDSVGSDPRMYTPPQKYIFLGLTVPRTIVSAAMANIITKHLKSKSVAILSSSNAFCTSGLTFLKNDLQRDGAKVVTEQEFATGSVTFVSQATRLKASGAKTIFMCSLGGTAQKYIPQLRNDGVKATLVGTATVADPSVVSSAGKTGNGFYLDWEPSVQFQTATAGPMGQLKKELKAAYPSTYAKLWTSAGQFAIFGYVDAFVGAQAIKDAGKNPTRDGIVKAFEHLQDYVPGRKGNFPYAVPVGLPEGWSAKDRIGHRGGERLQGFHGKVASLGSVNG
jgi:branched-chain amino acid transport system substrate-binding protein